MIRVVVTGSECTGKTTLARELAAYYSTVWVPEYARRYVEEIGRLPRFEDVSAVARGQIELEDSFVADATRLIVLDTDLLSTIVYSRHYYGDCPEWIPRAWVARAGDLYLLAAIDVPWVADGLQRDRGDRRDEMHELFRAALIDCGVRFVELAGPHERRLDLASSNVDRLLASSRDA